MRVRVCPASAVPAGGMKAAEVAGHPLLLANIGGRFLAVEDVCTHARARLSDGHLDEGECTVECPLHGGKFSLESGEALEFPAEDPLPVYPVTVIGGEIHVDLPDD